MRISIDNIEEYTEKMEYMINKTDKAGYMRFVNAIINPDNEIIEDTYEFEMDLFSELLCKILYQNSMYSDSDAVNILNQIDTFIEKQNELLFKRFLLRNECSVRVAEVYFAKKYNPAAVEKYMKILITGFERLIDNEPLNIYNFIEMANAYMVYGDSTKALEIMEQVEDIVTTDDEIKYFNKHLESFKEGYYYTVKF